MKESNKTIEVLYSEYKHHLSVFDLKTTDNILKTFILSASANPGKTILDHLLEWYQKHDTENNNSYNVRIGHINRFVRYLNTQGYDLPLGKILPPEPIGISYIPTEEELKNLFRAADEYADTEIANNNPIVRLRHRIKAIQAPVYTRMLYSTGMRSYEAENLDRKDVDLEHGTILIDKTKGYNDRTIAIHPSLLPILKEYDRIMDTLVPDRKAFFSNEEGTTKCKRWMGDMFTKLWWRYNVPTKGAVVYCLRHLYAIMNITSWDEYTDLNLCILAKSMGHKNVETTIRHYYQWIPKAGENFNSKTSSFFESILNKPDPNED